LNAVNAKAQRTNRTLHLRIPARRR